MNKTNGKVRGLLSKLTDIKPDNKLTNKLDNKTVKKSVNVRYNKLNLIYYHIKKNSYTSKPRNKFIKKIISETIPEEKFNQ